MHIDINSLHISVLPQETLGLLNPQRGQTWIDATTGLGGHTRLLAEAVGPSGRILAIDQDQAMLVFAQDRVPCEQVIWRHANFDQIPEILQSLSCARVDGLLADLGFCSAQMADPARGFSFQNDGPLDMRLNPTAGTTAAELIQTLSEGALADVLYQYGEERLSRRIAKRIVEARQTQRIETTFELAQIVRRAVPRSGTIDPATRTFQALRIAVNDELGVLERLLAILPGIIKPGGRVGLISFHSLEDRLVKQALWKQPELWHPMTKKPVEASADELTRNPRSRSAKLRVAERV